jgi:endonuclease G
MCRRGSLILLVLFLVALTNSAFCQETVQQRLDRLEIRLDSLLAALTGQAEIMSGYRVLKDTLNLLYGIAGPRGTVLDKTYFIINHNDDWKIPYWVAYYLSYANLQGNQGRTDDFRPDPQLPAGQRSELEDYRNSGFDRGHNAPAAAFKRSREAMSTTFLLSNMSPQTPRLNRNIWQALEEQVRDVTLEKGEAWIVTGNIFMSADSQFVAPTEHIGPNRVAVPTHCFKAILTLDENSAHAIYAFLLPNDRDYISGRPVDYLIKADRLEEITGYDFFPELADEIENNLESIVPSTWPR